MPPQTFSVPSTSDQVEDLLRVLRLVRSGSARTRPELGRQTGLGRSIISQRVDELIESGLIRDGALGPSTGGRAPRELQFCADAGYLLVAELGATSMSAGLADLSGAMLAHQEISWDIAAGPDATLDELEKQFTRVVSDADIQAGRIWGIGIGVPGPVEFLTGFPVSPPIMPGWDRYDIRARLGSTFQAPVWVDNEVNLMALGELSAAEDTSEFDLIYVKVGSSIGAGIISAGRLHRGAQGSAGDIGHIESIDGEGVMCSCGNLDCLAALAGGTAIARQAAAAAESGASPFLARRAKKAPVTAIDVADGAQRGDAVCLSLLTVAGSRIGRVLAQLANAFNPSHVIIGGGVAESGDVFLASIRQAVYSRSTPLATRDLAITLSPVSKRAGLRGAATMVVDELLRPELLAIWFGAHSPHGIRGLTDPALDLARGA